MSKAAPPDKTAPKQSGRFQPGQSGNPAGRPIGSRHRTTIMAEALLDGQAQAIVAKCIELAVGGDTAALRLAMDRLLPARKDRPIKFALPPIETTADLTKAGAAILQAVAAGELTPAEAGELSRVVADHGKAIELVDLDARLRKLEEGKA